MNDVSFDISAKHSAAFAGNAGGCVYIVGPPGPTSQQLMSQRTTELFTGTACFRMVVRIRSRDCANSTHYCKPQQFEKAIKDLAGCRKPVVEFELPNPESVDQYPAVFWS